MPDRIPFQVWIFLLLAIAAIVPVRYVFRYVSASPSRRDITRPPEDLAWRSGFALAANIALLLVLAICAWAILTPTAAAVARSGTFLPVILGIMGIGAIATVVRSQHTGQITPLVKGWSPTFDRTAQPRRFWIAAAWNGLLGVGMLVCAIIASRDAPQQLLRSDCLDWDGKSVPTAAIAACTSLLEKAELESERAKLLAARGSGYYRTGRYDRALQDYAAALRLDPADSSSHFNRGLIYERRKQRSSAFAEYSAALRADPENERARMYRGLIRLDASDISGAIQDFSQALTQSPDDPWLRANRGIAYAWQRDRVRADADFAAVPSGHDAYVIVLRGRALFALTDRDDARALTLLSAAIARDPQDRWSLSRRAGVFMRLGDYDRMRADNAAAQRIQDRELAAATAAR